MNTYGSSCYNCGGWSTAGAAAAGVAVGVVAGAAVVWAHNTAVAANAYNAGYVAGATTAPPQSATVNTSFAPGAIYAVLPTGCISPSVHGGTYYLCGNTWFQPAYGANGVFYRVVAAP
ncbi:hypothetical protein PQR67_36575 [Paraburkholderia fungorum]|uniref:hypothetical protein n=1 Tax=Paraburkholderia fungorum TaxID=134537 RepID=UPI0038BCBF4C